MGCKVSCAKDTVTLATKSSRRNTIVIKPKAGISVGKGIDLSGDGTKVIFVFGGPGSGKGTVVNNLVDMFQLTFVCGEDLILQNLRKKLIPDDEEHVGQSSNNATIELAKMLRNSPAELTLHWVLEMIEEEIQKHPGQPVLVDVMPNLKFLLRVDGFLTSPCKNEMEMFETKHPVSLAINLELDRDHLIQNINQTHACVKAPKADKPSDGTAPSGDELDTSKTQRRFELYSQSVNNFISYFRSRDKLLSVDTSCGDISAVWESVQDYIVQSGIVTPLKTVSVVILFTFGDDEDLVDLERYPFHEVILEKLVQNPNGEPVQLLKSLAKYIDSLAGNNRIFLVRLANTSLTKESVNKFVDPEVMFVSVDVGQLDYFIHGLQRRTTRKKSITRKQAQLYKAVCSTDNETLLFSTDTDTELCRRIAICLRTGRTFKAA